MFNLYTYKYNLLPLSYVLSVKKNTDWNQYDYVKEQYSAIK